MTLNKQKGHMYGFVSHTHNTVQGRCHQSCRYCYNLGRPFFEGELRLNEKNLKDDLGKGNFIFVGSSNDLFQKDVPDEWVIKTLEHCNQYNDNKYLFQSKNPIRFNDFIDKFPANSYFGTTLESNRNYDVSQAPSIASRAAGLSSLETKFKFVTIEPILEFDLVAFVILLQTIKPQWINIGADSKNHKLPEPSKYKITQLINELKQFTEVKIKDNLARICPTR